MKLEKIPTTHQVKEVKEKATGLGTGILFRKSSHALTGYVCACYFLFGQEARAFARQWAQVIGGSIKIARAEGAGFWVAVPVQKPSY
jgi:hypothetical protein